VGLDLQSARDETLRLLGTPPGSGGGRVTGGEAFEKLRLARFVLRVEFEGGYWLEKRFQRAADVIAFLKTLPDA
jgi:hypothetical protein